MSSCAAVAAPPLPAIPCEPLPTNTRNAASGIARQNPMLSVVRQIDIPSTIHGDTQRHELIGRQKEPVTFDERGDNPVRRNFADARPSGAREGREFRQVHVSGVVDRDAEHVADGCFPLLPARRRRNSPKSPLPATVVMMPSRETLRIR